MKSEECWSAEEYGPVTNKLILVLVFLIVFVFFIFFYTRLILPFGYSMSYRIWMIDKTDNVMYIRM